MSDKTIQLRKVDKKWHFMSNTENDLYKNKKERNYAHTHKHMYKEKLASAASESTFVNTETVNEIRGRVIGNEKIKI